ncbi:uncharacterized protein [Procambarus clarkii]|uniref:uncharacterized protein isoform X1 n=1 Tax=Procambarus clarkii TaxID=6728 RepID=UPI003742F28D
MTAKKQKIHSDKVRRGGSGLSSVDWTAVQGARTLLCHSRRVWGGPSPPTPLLHTTTMRVLLLAVVGVVSGVAGYSKTPKQYHIQTDTGPDRYFRYQTYNGQYRKEKRLDDGTVIGTYGWVDATGLLRLYDYIADTKGYRIVRQKTMKVPKITEPPPETPVTQDPSVLHITQEPSISQLTDATKRPLVPAPTEVQAQSISPPITSVPGSEPTRRDPPPSVPLYEPTRRDPTSSIPLFEPTRRDPISSVPLSQPTRRDPTSTSVSGSEFTKSDLSSASAQGPLTNPVSRPQVTTNTKTRTRGSTRWGGRPAASHNLRQQLRPFRRTQPKPDTSPNLRRPSTGEQDTGLSRTPNTGTDDLPTEGKFTINYDLGNQFHFEKILSDGTKVGKHGYVDPLGILRVSHYTSGPAGHNQRQESRWVGSRDPYNP